MCGKSSHARERTSTLCAQVRFGPRMHKLVPNEAVVLPEHFPTSGAKKRPLATVLTQVVTHGTCLYKRLSAWYTCVRQFTKVQPPMFAEICREIETLTAVGAHKRLLLAVSAFVIAQAAWLREALTTLRAHIWPLLRVGHLMTAEHREDTEAFAALGALVRFDPATLSAAAGLGVGVRLFPVYPETLFLAKCSITSTALIAATAAGSRHLWAHLPL